jgi:hypothetical protein
MKCRHQNLAPPVAGNLRAGLEYGPTTVVGQTQCLVAQQGNILRLGVRKKQIPKSGARMGISDRQDSSEIQDTALPDTAFRHSNLYAIAISLVA